MMPLDEKQKDALIEIGNIGMSRAAKQLSTLLQSAVNISIPQIRLLKATDIPEEDLFAVDKNLAYVYQTIERDLRGSAVLIFDREHTRLLTHSVIGDMPKLSGKEVRACEQEAMVEIGNIIITSCISTIVNMLGKNVSLSVPTYNEAIIHHLIDDQINIVDAKAEGVFMVATQLETASQDISGHLVLLLTDDSILSLLNAINKLLKG